MGLKELNGQKTAIVQEQSDLVGVEQCEIEGIWITPKHVDFEIENPLELPNLKTVYVSECQQPLVQLLRANSLAKVDTLIVAKSDATFEGIQEVGYVSTLKTLTIRNQSIKDEGLRWLAMQQSIKKLSLTNSNVVESTIQQLSCNESLRRLDLFGNQELNLTERSGRTFPFVRSLDVSSTSVSGKLIEIVKVLFPKLERLIAQETKLMSEDLERLANWGQLLVFDSGSSEIDFDNHGDEFWDL